MERTRNRLILGKGFKYIPFEGFNSMEWIPSLGTVSYLSDEEAEEQEKVFKKNVCPITGVEAEIDREWKYRFERTKTIEHTILPSQTEVYVRDQKSIIARFYAYDSEGIIFDRMKAIEYAERFVRSLEPLFTICPNCDTQNDIENSCCKFCGWTI